ncbi:hypothetical protein GCM10009853_029080 [Glycomyces scopariae]
MRDPAGVRDGAAHVVDQLLADDLLVVPHGIEDLADRERGRGVLPDQAQRLLVLGGRDVFEPEQVVGFERLPELRGLDRGEPVVRVVQQREFGAELVPDGLEHPGHVAEVGARVPVLLGRTRAALGRLVVVADPVHGLVGRVRGDPVDRLQPRDPGLDAEGPVPLLLVGADGVEEFGEVLAGGVPVREEAVP